MKFLTAPETHAWLDRPELTIKRDGSFLSFPDNKSHCFVLELPIPVYRLPQFVNYLMPFSDDEYTSVHESLLWFTDWDVWGDISETTAMFIMESMRNRLGETCSQGETPGLIVAPSELVALRSLFVVPVLFGWDAYLVPRHGEWFVFCSHDEHVYVVSRTQATHHELFESMSSWNPKEAAWV